MTIYKVSNSLLTGLSTDTKPTTYASGTIFVEQDTGVISKSSSGSWTALTGVSLAQTLTNKTISSASNTLTVNATSATITDTSTAAGDILKSNGTKFVRLARGTANQVLATNSGATDVAWATLNNETVGTATASGDGSTTVFTIAHSLGTTPYAAFVQVSSTVGSNIAFSFTYDGTNITITFSTAPASGTNNLTFQWIAIA